MIARVLRMVLPRDKHFYVFNGPAIKDLRQLVEELQRMSDDSFYHHVTPFKNDFARWINDCFKDRTLAKRIGRLKDKADITKTLFARLYA